MFSSEITARLRTVLDEVCADLSKYETSTRALVASKILEKAALGDVSVEGLKAAGHQALSTLNLWPPESRTRLPHRKIFEFRR